MNSTIKQADGITCASAQWYALQVNCRKEHSVAAQMTCQGIECLLPRYKSTRIWSDRVKEVEQALFPGYLFCRFAYNHRQRVLGVAGVVQVVGNGSVGSPIPDSEIEALQAAVDSDLPTQPWPYLEVGELVQIKHGRLNGIQGILINFRGNHRVVLSVTLLQRSLALEVDLDWVQAVGQRVSAASARRPGLVYASA